MSMATLVYTYDKIDNDEKLLSGSLAQIDNCTRMYTDETALATSMEFRERIANYQRRNQSYLDSHPWETGRFKVSFIEDNSRSEEVDIIYDDPRPIITKTSYMYGEETTNEIEQSRKLLFSSKDKNFLRSCLGKDWFSDTTGYLIRLNGSEFAELTRNGYKPKYNVDGYYYLSIGEILEYHLKEKKLNSVRSLVEDALEVWKEKIEELPNDLLYYYCRNLRLEITKYSRSLKSSKSVTNFKANIYLMVPVALGNGTINRVRSRKNRYRKSEYTKVKRMDAA